MPVTTKLIKHHQRAALRDSLIKTDGNIAAAARYLNVTRFTIYAWLREHPEMIKYAPTYKLHADKKLVDNE